MEQSFMSLIEFLKKYHNSNDFYSIEINADGVRLQGRYTDFLMEKCCLRSSFESSQNCFVCFSFLFNNIAFRIVLT